MHWYNENDPRTAAWLRELIAQGHLPQGIVDERSIVHVRADELRDYTSCHFFAGIGGWPYALRLAGWPDDLPVDTGSCPCQPFSCAGKRKGTRDERDLWPHFKAIIAQRRPPVVFGEQVASKAGRLWLSRVRADLEALGYAVGCADLCAASISAPMVSQRLHWVAEAPSQREHREHREPKPEKRARDKGEQEPDSDGERSNPRLASANCTRCEELNAPAVAAAAGQYSRTLAESRLASTNGYHSHWWSGPLQVGWNCLAGEVERGGRKHRAQWRIKPGLPLLAHGVPGRVAQLCGFGNAIVPQLAAEFIQAYCEIA